MQLKGKHIFVIEDNQGNRAIMMTILQMAGARTYFDQWGTHTLDRIREADTVDLILMDLMLPQGVSGYDIFEQLQADEELAEIPVVIVSASDPAIEMKKARKMGFQGFISKPVNYARFAALIARILDGEQIWADDAALS